MFGLKGDWSLEVKDRYFTLDDYCGAEPRWCTGCGDHGILAAVHRVCRESQIAPEKTVAVSGTFLLFPRSRPGLVRASSKNCIIPFLKKFLYFLHIINS